MWNVGVKVVQQTDVLIIGCGLAGLATAWGLAKKGVNVSILAIEDDLEKPKVHQGIAGIAFQGDRDRPSDFAQDLVNCGEGYCNQRAVEQLSTLGPQYVQEVLIEELGVEFDQSDEGIYKRQVYPGHSTARVVGHGYNTMASLLKAFRAKLHEKSNVRFLTNRTVIDLLTLAQHSTKHTDAYKQPSCVGAYVLNGETGEVETLLAKETVIATGGVGHLFLHTTNGAYSRGDGLALAARAGARVMHLDKVEFKTTTLYVPGEPRCSVTESLREAGAVLINSKGQEFLGAYANEMDGYSNQAVSRAICTEMTRCQEGYVWMDLSKKDPAWIKGTFPHEYEICLSKGYDITKEKIPVVPAAHYFAGGIMIDRTGQTSLKRLRAIGEVGCSGVHGRAALAGVPGLEALVWANTCAKDIINGLDRFAFYFPSIKKMGTGRVPVDHSLLLQDWNTVRQTMWNYVGIVKDTPRIRRANSLLGDLYREIRMLYNEATLSSEFLGLYNGVHCSMMMARVAGGYQF